ncbi:flagellar basal body P-ring formation chaperone FlgA [Oceanicella actignis]|uniref:Flagella basal body P-ring formation protein FlgA n=1 Tax=Oceanicella actignis TaxID=1189325 RepID=A0A1M7T666_9RHOB|nr:flagellar basal body P-ring formation chaperone FlgA [Oceanicella actignis]SET44339.1 flagella basal body P-ring formation protein FlgA [Oceanicella actignis]SHN66223.1 flagella basal body P-ring formation protein FlgA [Oceanicella actignis]
MRKLLFMAMLLLVGATDPGVAAQTDPESVVIATRTIRSRSIIGPEDVALATNRAAPPGAVTDVEAVVGKEARTSIYAGRPIMRGHVQDPAIVERNELVRLIFRKGALFIAADGRALERGGLGQRVTVMNLDSRATVVGRVSGPGEVEVSR